MGRRPTSITADIRQLHTDSLHQGNPTAAISSVITESGKQLSGPLSGVEGGVNERKDTLIPDRLAIFSRKLATLLNQTDRLRMTQRPSMKTIQIQHLKCFHLTSIG